MIPILFTLSVLNILLVLSVERGEHRRSLAGDRFRLSAGLLVLMAISCRLWGGLWVGASPDGSVFLSGLKRPKLLEYSVM